MAAAPAGGGEGGGRGEKAGQASSVWTSSRGLFLPHWPEGAERRQAPESRPFLGNVFRDEMTWPFVCYSPPARGSPPTSTPKAASGPTARTIPMEQRQCLEKGCGQVWGCLQYAHPLQEPATTAKLQEGRGWSGSKGGGRGNKYQFPIHFLKVVRSTLAAAAVSGARAGTPHRQGRERANPRWHLPLAQGAAAHTFLKRSPVEEAQASCPCSPLHPCPTLYILN